ncbi:MAG: hypothetical protein RIB45_02240 [Marivibrio sp.]|uniref:hypothetical protein n=1 Tax=Marivibrio sp. TaxID=2039719 RepID=UPI0032EDB296
MKRLLAGLALTLIAASSAAADDHLASGAEIRAAISGNTVQGSMIDAGAYTEFYAADETIKGDGYTGAWSVDGDRMCFAYGEDPATCWSVAIDGDQVTWVKDGETDGTGTIVPGNPNDF